MNTEPTPNQPVATETPSPCRRCWATTIARLLMGLGFTVFGLNGFLNFMPQPKTLPEPVMSFMGAMMKTGYMLQLISATQLLVGILLLINLFVPLALILIAPVLVNIILFHVFLQPSGLPPGLIFTALELYLAWCYREAFRPLLKAKS